MAYLIASIISILGCASVMLPYVLYSQMHGPSETMSIKEHILGLSNKFGLALLLAVNTLVPFLVIHLHWA